jgi:hypothetical protein
MSRIISHRSLKLHNRENTLCSQCNQIEDEKHFLNHWILLIKENQLNIDVLPTLT